MSRQRVEAFSDGIIAILATIMVLELREPGGTSWHDVAGVLPVLAAYLISFVMLCIYWVNHHSLFTSISRITPGIIWANNALLFALSLVPFVTGWANGHLHESLPAVVYGIVGFVAGEAFFILVVVIARAETGAPMGQTILARTKGFLSPLLWLVGSLVATFAPIVAYVMYAGILAMWIIPERETAREAALED